MTENARHAAFRQCVLAAATAIVAILIVIAVAFATQGHNDRVLMEDLDRTGVELQLLGRQKINELTKRQTAVIHAMASLPEPERVKFWHEQFAPLAAEEHALREKLRVTGQRTPPGGRVQ